MYYCPNHVPKSCFLTSLWTPKRAQNQYIAIRRTDGQQTTAQLTEGSHVVFANGEVDPWHWLSILVPPGGAEANIEPWTWRSLGGTLDMGESAPGFFPVLTNLGCVSVCPSVLQ